LIPSGVKPALEAAGGRHLARGGALKVHEADHPAIFAGLETKLAGLPGRHGPPTGCLVLARLCQPRLARRVLTWSRSD
jgi:hypothetical protein